MYVNVVGPDGSWLKDDKGNLVEKYSGNLQDSSRDDSNKPESTAEGDVDPLVSTPFHCGQDGKKISNDDIGKSLIGSHGGTYVNTAAKSHFTIDSPDESEIGECEDDYYGDDEYGEYGGYSSLNGDSIYSTDGLQMTTMSYSDACNSTMSVDNVVSITVNLDTMEVSIVTDGDPQDDGSDSSNDSSGGGGGGGIGAAAAQAAAEARAIQVQCEA